MGRDLDITASTRSSGGAKLHGQIPQNKTRDTKAVSDSRSCQSGGLPAVRFPTCIPCDGTLLWMMLQVKNLGPCHSDVVEKLTGNMNRT